MINNNHHDHGEGKLPPPVRHPGYPGSVRNCCYRRFLKKCKFVKILHL